MSQGAAPLRVAVVGPCAVGKSTLVRSLRASGYEVRQPAQEHSGVPDMWRRMVQPDVLVYLDAAYDTLKAHRPTISWGPRRLSRLNERLSHARKHADFLLSVDGLSADDVQRAVEHFLEERTLGA